MDSKEEIIKLLKKETNLKDINLEVPPDSSLGDYAFPCFQLAKEFKKNPVEIAKDLSEKIKVSGSIKEIKSTGPYLNFFIDKQGMAADVIKKILKEGKKFGKGNNKKEKIMVEYVGPNTNKSLHLGHVRNGLLGAALSNILEFDGFNVIRTSINNDRGAGMTEAMLGYKKFHKGEKLKIKADHFVAECYVDFKKALAKNPSLKKEVDQMLLDWEKGKKDVVELWKKMVDWVYEGYKETYKSLGIKFDKEYYESKIYKEGKDIVEKGLKKEIFKKEDGAVIADLEKYKLPNKVLLKSDGTSVYMTQDLYLAQLRDKDFKPDRMIYVVASEQDNHFRQLFKILELLGFKKSLYHLSYGLVNLPSGRMKSREGNVVDADNLIEEVVSLAKKEIKKRHKDLSSKEIDKRAVQIGLGALKFFMVKFDNITSFTFNPEDSLSFEGETGPYVQYAHARICSILRKDKSKVEMKYFDKLNTVEDEKLISLLALFPSVVSKAASDYKPHLVSRYLLDLAQGFNEFYHAQQILKAEKEVKIARLNLISAVKQVLENGLKLLGIDAPEKM